MHCRVAYGVHQNTASASKDCTRRQTGIHWSVTVWHTAHHRHQLRHITSLISLVGVISGLVYTVKTTGFLSLYNGLGVTLVGSIPKAGIRFGGNAYCKKLLADDKGKLNMAQQFAAGMGAGTIEAILAVTPMETIKTKLIEVNHLSHLNPLSN